jgi:hypothetical protein
MRQLTTSLQNCHHGDYHLPIYLAHTISYYPTLRFADKWIWSPKKYYPNYSLVVYKCLKPIFFIFFSICSLYVSHISMAFFLNFGLLASGSPPLLGSSFRSASGAQYWGVPTRVRAKEAPPPMASALGAAKTNRKMWRKLWCVHHVLIPSWTIYYIINYIYIDYI